jgi:diguanylate cyclase (GGDEF)-like protein
MDTQTIVILAVAINLVVAVLAIALPPISRRRARRASRRFAASLPPIAPAFAGASLGEGIDPADADQPYFAAAEMRAADDDVAAHGLAADDSDQEEPMTIDRTADTGSDQAARDESAALDVEANVESNLESNGHADNGRDRAGSWLLSATMESAVDPQTGLDLEVGWSRWLAEEEARIRRFPRPATIVLVDLAGFERLSELLGREAAERLIPPIATTMRRYGREADHLARLGPARFAALLPETDEIQAINFVERIRTACDVWLASGAVALRLAIGWSEIGPERTAAAALPEAEQRLFADRQRTRLEAEPARVRAPGPALPAPSAG